jgi:hypothetical protein
VIALNQRPRDLAEIRKIILKSEKVLKYNQSIIETEIETMLEISPDDGSEEERSEEERSDEKRGEEERSDEERSDEERSDKKRGDEKRGDEKRDDEERSDEAKSSEKRSHEERRDERWSKEDEMKRPIKDASPFTKIFQDLFEKCSKEVANQTIKLDKLKAKKNKYHSLEFIEKLLNDYMPYCFIWASFSFQGLSFSRITNGAIENYNGFRKRNVTKKPPHRYIDSNFAMVQGGCIEFIESSIQEKQQKKTSGRKSKVSTIFVDAAEETEFESVEKYRKSSLAPANDFGYQRQVVFDENISLFEQTELEFRNLFIYLSILSKVFYV